MRSINLLVVFALAAVAGAQTVQRSPEIPKFMGREVVVYAPSVDTDGGVFPAGPAKLCIEGPPQEQCYTEPKDFGADVRVEIEQLSKDKSALLFSARAGGVSGWDVH